MPKNKSINLLPQEEFDASTLGRALKWAMGTFRMIVIATEMVVMAAFLSRFWLDAKNSDLSEEIKIKSAQISAQSSFEKRFRELQKKLNITKVIQGDAKKSGKLDLIASKIPQDVTLSSVSVAESSAEIRGVSVSEFGVAQLISNFKNEKDFKKVDLTSLGTSESSLGLIVFTVSIKY